MNKLLGALSPKKRRRNQPGDIYVITSESEEEDIIEIPDEDDDDEEDELEYESDYDQSDYSGAAELENDEFDADDSRKHESPLLFKQYTTADLVAKMSSIAKHYSDILGLSKDDTITLLQFYSWNNERLMDDYMDDPDGIKSKAGILTTSTSSLASEVQYYPDNGFMCPICCDDQSQSFQLSCKHEFCLDCYGRYVKDKITTGKVITCPSCDLALSSRDIDAISGQGESFKLLESSIREYVARQKNFKWCPSPDCNVVVEILNAAELPNIVERNQIPIATCQHGHQFCVYCTFENHTPAPCNVTKAWITKCKDDSETVKWIVTNTKQCPKCESSIEKNGGCNHMTCKKCRYEFCWICMGVWKQHGNAFYQCNRYNSSEQNNSTERKTIEENRRSLKRYIHYYNLFTVHEQSTKQDNKRCTEVEDLVRQLQEKSGISWIEAQFVAESATTLLRARSVLKWSYAFAYYCNSTTFLNIFETVQANLSEAVEGLSKLFEIEDPLEIVEMKLEFLNKQRFLIDRQNAMISCSKETIANGSFTLTNG